MSTPVPEADVFFAPPASGTVGYRPSKSGTRPLPASAVPPAPRQVRPATTLRPFPAAAIVKGIFWLGGAALVILFVVRGCAEVIKSAGNVPAPGMSTPVVTPCPARIAARLPEGGSAQLVVAYRTTDKQIVLCKHSSGKLYYHGAYTANPEEAITVPATATPRGYLARNGTYEYEIADTEVIVRNNGRQIGRQSLVSWPSPS
ncbi:hypothetical protein [Amycolatopsis sp. NPDC059021]|uniref:hypothetical protein n=1 Tax=Amycolatopsis sp. NPDC059021 TaxID=3346704 RepID=UPI00366B298A